MIGRTFSLRVNVRPMRSSFQIQVNWWINTVAKALRDREAKMWRQTVMAETM
ncbi:MAG: hypothetical protein QOG89_3716, partial [Thermomicrobiales bacterium]|nr:hypothetical protein [Thermomicrobiales bacterium]